MLDAEDARRRPRGVLLVQYTERVKGMTIVRTLGRIWIPLVVLLVIGAGGLVVSRVHGIFGSDTRPSYGSVAGNDRYNPKEVRYEVFGPADTVASISYFNAESQPQEVKHAALPWSVTITMNAPAVVANLVAQGDSSSLGCRIVVDGQVKSERVTNEVNAYTHCEVQGA